MMQSLTACHSLMDKAELTNYVHSHLPHSVHMSLNLDKDEYTQEEAKVILSEALDSWAYIKQLRREEHGEEN